MIYAELADDRTQNRFLSLDIDGLQYKYRFVDEVSASSYVNQYPNLTQVVSLVPWLSA